MEDEEENELVVIIFEITFQNVIHPTKIFRLQVEKDQPFGLIFETFCELNNIKRKNYKFRHEGGPIRAEETPNSLEVEDGGIIVDVFRKQQGSTVGFVFQHFDFALQIFLRKIRKHCQTLSSGLPMLI